MELCGDWSGRKLDIINVELHEDWISQPWGAKHQKATSRRVSITQRVRLTAKDQREPLWEESRSDEPLDPQEGVAASRYQQQSLVYAFGQPEAASVLDDEAISQFLEEIKELRSIAFQPTELVKRRVSSLRRRLLDRFHSLSPLQLASLTEQARRQLTPPQWYSISFRLSFTNTITDI